VLDLAADADRGTVLKLPGCGGFVLAQAISDAGWGKLVQFLRYKLAWSGGSLVEVVAAYSSQTCSVCGYVDKANRHGETFYCLKCGYAEHADTNAAKVLLSRGNHGEAACGGSAEVRRPAKQELRVVRRGTRSLQGLGPSFSANAPAFRPG
jgi:transposase